MGQEDYRDVDSFLKRLVRGLKLLRGIEGLCLTVISLLVLFSLGVGIDLIRSFFPYAPLVYSVLTSLILLLLLGWTLFQCLRRMPRERAARYVEKKHPYLKNNLINSLQLFPQINDPVQAKSISSSMVLALLRTTRRQLQEIRIKELLDTRRLKVEARLAAMLFVPVLAIVLFNPSSVDKTFSLLLYPLRDMPPAHTSIEVLPKNVRVLRGTPVAIHAVGTGAVPKSMELILSSAASSDIAAAGAEIRNQERLSMDTMEPGRFTATIADVQKNLRYRVATGPFSSPWYTIEAVDAPEVGNLKIILHAPHYTGLAAQTFPTGNIEGMKGSTVAFQASTNKEVVKARILFDEGKELPLKIDERKLQGNFVLFQSQKYRIQIEDRFGFRNSPISYEIRVNADGLPAVDLLRPAEDLEVSGDETLPLEFSVRDDFGIQEVALVVRNGERSDKIPLHREGNPKSIVRERFNWELGKLALREKDEVIYHLEALDNDTITGPKIGVSRALRLRLKDLKGEHNQVADMIRDLSTRMVDLLADHLEGRENRPEGALKETPAEAEPPRASFEQSADAMMKRIEEIMQRTEKDRLSDFATWSDLEALKRNLQFTRDDLLKKQENAATPEEQAKAHDDISTELERMSMLAEDISKRLEGQRVASTAQDVMKSQERLMDSLEKLRSGDKKIDEVLKEISQLANLLGSLQQSLSQMASRLPDEFMNSDAARSMPFGEMLSALDEIRKKLMQGDIEGAMQLARELFNQLASMVASLQNAQRSAMSSGMDRMQGEMMRSANELQQIAREQQELLVDTEAVQKQGQGAREEFLKDRLEAFQKKAYEDLSRMAELFPDEEREVGQEAPRPGETLDDATVNHLVKNMIERLLKKDFTAFNEVMELAEKELAKKRMPRQDAKAGEAQASLKGLKDNLERLLSEPLAAMSEDDKKKLRDLTHREGVLKERTQDLHEKLESLFQLFPSLDPKITQNIQEAGRSMGKAEDRLGALDSRGAVPPERDALDRLSQSQQQMQNAMEQLAQRGQLGRMPVSFLFRRGRFLPSGRLVPLPGMPQFPQFEVEGGFTGLDTERFQLPGKEEYKAPRTFREEILESMKQGMPPQYKEQIENYLRNLSE
jgi:hypothetical protein